MKLSYVIIVLSVEIKIMLETQNCHAPPNHVHGHGTPSLDL